MAILTSLGSPIPPAKRSTVFDSSPTLPRFLYSIGPCESGIRVQFSMISSLQWTFNFNRYSSKLNANSKAVHQAASKYKSRFKSLVNSILVAWKLLSCAAPRPATLSTGWLAGRHGWWLARHPLSRFRVCSRPDVVSFFLLLVWFFDSKPHRSVRPPIPTPTPTPTGAPSRDIRINPRVDATLLIALLSDPVYPSVTVFARQQANQAKFAIQSVCLPVCLSLT